MTVRWVSPEGAQRLCCCASQRRISMPAVLRAPGFPCMLPAGAVPALVSGNSVHSKKRWDSGGLSKVNSQTQDQPQRRERESAIAAELGQRLLNPCLRSPEGTLGLQTARGDARGWVTRRQYKEGLGDDGESSAWGQPHHALKLLLWPGRRRSLQRTAGVMKAARGMPFRTTPRPPLPAP